MGPIHMAGKVTSILEADPRNPSLPWALYPKRPRTQFLPPHGQRGHRITVGLTPQGEVLPGHMVPPFPPLWGGRDAIQSIPPGWRVINRWDPGASTPCILRLVAPVHGSPVLLCVSLPRSHFCRAQTHVHQNAWSVLPAAPLQAYPFRLQSRMEQG